MKKEQILKPCYAGMKIPREQWINGRPYKEKKRKCELIIKIEKECLIK